MITLSLIRDIRLLISASKHWVAQSTASLPTVVSLRKHANQQTRLINCLKSTDVFQLDRSEKSSRHDDQSYEPIEEKDDDDVPNTLQSNHTVGDRSFMPHLHHPLAEKDRKHDGPRVTKKDAQVQTSSRKTPRRKKTMRKSRPTNEGILSRENISDNPTFKSSIADLRSDFHSSNGTNRNEDYDSRLSIKFLENKRAEYINKFTAVKRQIEEITATLKETCYGEKSSRGKPKNSEGYLSSARDDANENSKQDVDPDEVGDEEDNRTERKMILREEKNTSEEEDEIIGRSAGDPKSIKNILDVSNINDGPQVFFDKKCSNNTIVSTTNLYGSPSADDVFVHDCIRAFTIKEMLHPSNGTPRICHKKRAKCRFVKQISFDLDFTKDNDEPWGFSGEDRSVYLRDHFAAANDDDDAEVLMEDSSNLEEPRKHKMIVDEKVGEIAILNDIKRRIDRDFDDPSINSEKDTEDFLTFSQKTVNLENDSQLYQSAAANDTTSTMIVESPQSLDSSETQIRDSVWADTKSELSNRNSTFSIYHSCTQFSSLVSLRENEDELALEAEDRSEIDDDSHSNIDYYESNVHSNVDYSPVPGNGHTQSNLNFDRSHDDGQRIVQHNASKRKYTTSNKFLSGTIDESNEACDMFVDREMANQAYDCDHVDDESNEAERELHIHSEQQYTVDSTFETSKSSRYIGSIDSGVFVNSSLIDLQPHESSFDGSKLNYNKRKQRRMKERELHGSPRTFDFSSDSNSSSSSCCTDDTLDRRINDVIRDLTKKLVLYERKVRMKLMWKAGLRARDMRYVSIRELIRLQNPNPKFFDP